MWGCIEREEMKKYEWKVPSLYVRVYRGTWLFCQTLRRSLIICEGVSSKFAWSPFIFSFPHYMWGCIDGRRGAVTTQYVPSLYVRVYRPPHIHTGRIICSLIICEGVSAFLLFSLFYLVLPHYMWGCIALKAWMKAVQGAPSLYVRVYRPYSLHQICRWRSLIICEGVSELKKCYEQLQDAPSLYVRVYRSYHWFRWHLQRSLIICEGVSLKH